MLEESFELDHLSDFDTLDMNMYNRMGDIETLICSRIRFEFMKMRF